MEIKETQTPQEEKVVNSQTAETIVEEAKSEDKVVEVESKEEHKEELEDKGIIEKLKKEIEELKMSISQRDYDEVLKSQNFNQDNLEFVKTLSKDKYEKEGVEGLKKMFEEDKRFNIFKKSPNINEVPLTEKEEIATKDNVSEEKTDKEILLEIED